MEGLLSTGPTPSSLNLLRAIKAKSAEGMFKEIISNDKMSIAVNYANSSRAQGSDSSFKQSDYGF